MKLIPLAVVLCMTAISITAQETPEETVEPSTAAPITARRKLRLRSLP